jgi:hypothetical protein
MSSEAFQRQTTTDAPQGCSTVAATRVRRANPRTPFRFHRRWPRTIRLRLANPHPSGHPRAVRGGPESSPRRASVGGTPLPNVRKPPLPRKFSTLPAPRPEGQKAPRRPKEDARCTPPVRIQRFAQKEPHEPVSEPAIMLLVSPECCLEGGQFTRCDIPESLETLMRNRGFGQLHGRALDLPPPRASRLTSVGAQILGRGNLAKARCLGPGNQLSRAYEINPTTLIGAQRAIPANRILDRTFRLHPLCLVINARGTQRRVRLQS